MSQKKSLFVKPRKDSKVFDPRRGEWLPKSGAQVPANGYWLRRLRTGDVEEAQPPKTEAPKPSPKQPAAKAGKDKE